MEARTLNACCAGWLLAAGLCACSRTEISEAGAAPAPLSAEHPSATEAPPAATASLALPNDDAAAAPGSTTRVSAPTPAASPTVDAGRSDGGVVASDAGSTVDQCPYRLPPPTIPWSPDPWVPSAISDPVELFNAARSGMPGRWEGLATTPWVGSYRVEITFGADGTYSGRCTEFSTDCCEAFYFGTDLDTPLKTYSVEDATLSGNVTGELVLVVHYYYSDPNEFTVSSYPGDLSHIKFDATGSRLRFELRRNGKGPILYDLRRLPNVE
jgi:hypothetical protein